jgi:PadR family transcriptional regulator PadR
VEGDMETSHWLSQLRKGVLELLVLRLLALRGELHGYAVVKELLALGPLVAGENTIYPLVRRLESDGMLKSRWVESESGPPRKYYRLSDAGSQFLVEAQREWDSVAGTIDLLKGEQRNA